MRLLDEIEQMEQRVLNARTIDAAKAFHDKLDALRAKLDADPVKTAYERGYQAGYHAGIRKQFADRVECDHQGIGLPGCPTCDPKTRASLRERGIAIHDLACGRSPGHPDPLCTQCQIEVAPPGEQP